VLKFKRIRGTQDILPQQSNLWQSIEHTIRTCMAQYNYQELRTPVFEQTELFARSIGQTTDIVSKEMYTFLDRGHKNLTLKPEMTASMMRAYIENNLSSKSAFTKLYYISSLFRQENPQAGRLRQFHQFGAEALGSISPHVDVEIILLATEIYHRLGITDLKLMINSVGDPESRETYKAVLKSYLKPLLGQYCPNCQKRFDTNPLRILDCKESKCRALNTRAPRLIDYLSSDCRKHFEQVQSLLSNHGLPFDLNPFLVRGLDYYTRTVFEITSRELGSQDAICGGGRYDLLAEQLGGEPTPAVGFASGMERLFMVLEAQNKLPAAKDQLQIYISPLGDRAAHHSSILLQRLRHAGYTADQDYSQRSLKSQMREANRQQAQVVILIGDNEIDRGLYSVKDMRDGKQYSVSLNEIDQFIEKIL
jgi:histidyl-tRNA synthetase